MEDMRKLEARVLKGQEKLLRDQVVKKWHFWLGRLTRDAAREMDHGEAVTWVAGSLSEEIAEKVAEDMASIRSDIDADVVRAIWSERESYKVYRASYGLGTWLLGAEKARAVPEEEGDERERPKSERESARAQIDEKINRYLRNQRAARSAQSREGTEDDPELAWAGLSSSARGQFLRAHYAEFSGDMEIVRITFSECRACGGTGVREVLSMGDARSGSQSGVRIVACPTCHTRRRGPARVVPVGRWELRARCRA